MWSEEDEYRNPNWTTGGRVHNWKNYASEGLKELWSTFTMAQKKVIYDSLEEMAAREEWD